MGASTEDHVCPTCRLVQRRASGCRCCATSLLPLERVRFELDETVHRMRPGSRAIGHSFRGWRGPVVFLLTLVGVIAGIVVMIRLLLRYNRLLDYAWTMPVVLVLGAYLIARFFPVLKAQRRLSAARLSTPERQAGAETIGGVAHAHGRNVEGWLAEAEGEHSAVAAFVLLGPGTEQAYLRASRSTDFLLVDEAGRRLLIGGELWLASPLPAHAEKSHSTAALEAALGCGMLPDNTEARQWQLRAGDKLEIDGRVTREANAALAGGYRDDGLIETLRGTPGQPVIVRWLGVAEAPGNG